LSVPASNRLTSEMTHYLFCDYLWSGTSNSIPPRSLSSTIYANSEGRHINRQRLILWSSLWLQYTTRDTNEGLCIVHCSTDNSSIISGKHINQYTEMCSAKRSIASLSAGCSNTCSSNTASRDVQVPRNSSSVRSIVVPYV